MFSGAEHALAVCTVENWKADCLLSSDNQAFSIFYETSDGHECTVALEKVFRVMIGKPGPFQVVECEGDGNVDRAMSAPRRRYSCPNYQNCLEIGAALNWDNFTCRGCSAEVNESLVWQAYHARKTDAVASKLLSSTHPQIGEQEAGGKVIRLRSRKCA